MSVLINWGWDWEVFFVEALHEGVFFDGGQSREVEPTVSRSVLKVVSVGLYSSERCSSKSATLENNFISIFLVAKVDVAFFTHSNFLPNSLNDLALEEDI